MATYAVQRGASCPSLTSLRLNQPPVRYPVQRAPVSPNLSRLTFTEITPVYSVQRVLILPDLITRSFVQPTQSWPCDLIGNLTPGATPSEPLSTRPAAGQLWPRGVR